MSLQPVGAPDWLKSVPGAAKILASGAYSAPGNNSAVILSANVQAYRSLVLSWLPGQSQVLVVTFASDHLFSTGVINRTFTCNNPHGAQLTVPVLGAYVLISANKQDLTNNPTGTCVIAGVNSADRNAAGRGVVIAASQLSFNVAASTTTSLEWATVAEGMATVYVRSTSPSYFVFIEALDANNVWNLISEFSNLDTVPPRFQLQVPGYQCRFRLSNNDTSLRAFVLGVTIGD